MNAGEIKSATGKTYNVIYDESRRQVYVESKKSLFSKGTKSHVGKANSPEDAMRKAREYLSSY